METALNDGPEISCGTVGLTPCLTPPGSAGQNEPAALSALSCLQRRSGVDRGEGSHKGGGHSERCVCVMFFLQRMYVDLYLRWSDGTEHCSIA